MTPCVSKSTVMSAIWHLERARGQWPTSAEIADYLQVDQTIVKPLLRELMDRRLFRSRQRKGRKVWMPWEAV